LPDLCREFDSSRGLRVHHAAAHDELLANRTCADCGEEFYTEHEVKYCSDRCRDRSVSSEGASNPNYDGGKTRAECELCGSAFEYYPSEKRGLYCSTCVENESWRHRPEITGDGHPRWTGGKRPFDRDVCGATVRRYPSEVGETVCCSESCRAAWLSEAFTGEGHPNWAGGDVGPYGPGWATARTKALDRDDHTCICCGVDRDALGREPDVHHIVPVRTFADHPTATIADAHTLDNLVSLCPACHRSIEGRTPERRQDVWFQHVVGTG
jgi:5-methylcytosine-specific restriction endonuclease McrA